METGQSGAVRSILPARLSLARPDNDDDDDDGAPMTMDQNDETRAGTMRDDDRSSESGRGGTGLSGRCCDSAFVSIYNAQSCGCCAISRRVIVALILKDLSFFLVMAFFVERDLTRILGD